MRGLYDYFTYWLWKVLNFSTRIIDLQHQNYNCESFECNNGGASADVWTACLKIDRKIINSIKSNLNLIPPSHSKPKVSNTTNVFMCFNGKYILNRVQEINIPLFMLHLQNQFDKIVKFKFYSS